MSARSRTHLVLIPSYNPGRKVFETVRAARAQWDPVWFVVDGSTDGTTQGLEDIARSDSGMRVLVRAGNGGKGAAVLDGLLEALSEGYTHALTMDADGQHPADRIAPFMAASAANPKNSPYDRRTSPLIVAIMCACSRSSTVPSSTIGACS